MTQDKLEYQFKKAFLEQESEKYVDYLCELRTKQEVYAAIEKIALIQLQIKNCLSLWASSALMLRKMFMYRLR